MECKNCNSLNYFYSFIPFGNPNYKKPSDPKYLFHIGEICSDCGTHKKFAKQTEELMEFLYHSKLIK